MDNRYHRHNRRFACSIGEVSSAIIQKYIENQGQCVSTNKAPPIKAVDFPQTMLEIFFMKHHRFLYRTLSALLCLGLCAQLTACGKKPVLKPGSSGPSAPSVSKKVYDDSLITEVYDEEDSFTDEYGTEYSTSVTFRSWRPTRRRPRPSQLGDHGELRK